MMSVDGLRLARGNERAGEDGFDVGCPINPRRRLLVVTLVALLLWAASTTPAGASTSIGSAARHATFKNSGPGWAAWNATVSRVRTRGASRGGLPVAVRRTRGTTFAALKRPTIAVPASGTRYLATAWVAAGSAAAVGKPAALVVRERTRTGRVVRVTTSPTVKLKRRFNVVIAPVSAMRRGDRLEVFVIQRAAARGDVLLAEAVRVARQKPAGPPAAPPPTTLNDFEDGTSEGWTTDFGSGTAANTTNIAYHGAHSLGLTLSGAGNVAFRSAALPSPIAAGSQISYRVYAPGNSAVTVVPYTVDGAGAYTYGSQIPAFDEAWRTITFSVPTLTGGLRYLGLLVLDGQQWAGSIYLDTVTVDAAGTPVSVPTGSPNPTPAPRKVPGPDGLGGSWRLAFDDEFTGSSLNAQKWSSCFPWGCQATYSSEEQCYSPAHALVAGNALSLTATAAPATCNGASEPYTSGLITTAQSYQARYGYTEARFRIPAGKGLWPIIDLLPASQQWPPEVDLMEAGGSDPSTITMHYHYAASYYSPGWPYTGPDFSAAFHTIGVDVEPGAITWYVDGQRWARFTGAAQLAEINGPMYLVMGLAVGGPYDGATDSTTPFPASLRIDYVRAWQPG